MSARELVTSLDPGEIVRIEEEIKEIVAAVPGYVWDGRSLPVPVEDIAREVYGLRVLMVGREQMREAAGLEDEEGDISGMLLTGIGEIWVNSWEAGQDAWGSQRARFTVGHELGHFVMHQVRSPRLFCRSTATEEIPEDNPVPRPVTEVEANTFSASLLMPADLFRRRMGKGDINDQHRLKGEFAVSGKAARRRINSLRSLG